MRKQGELTLAMNLPIMAGGADGVHLQPSWQEHERGGLEPGAGYMSATPKAAEMFTCRVEREAGGEGGGQGI